MSVRCWEWARKTSIAKRTDVKYGAKNADGSFGSRYEYEQTQPERVETFTAEGASWDDDIDAYITLAATPLDQQTSSTIVDKDGKSWTGKIYRVEASPTAKGVHLYNFTVEMHNPVRA